MNIDDSEEIDDRESIFSNNTLTSQEFSVLTKNKKINTSSSELDLDMLNDNLYLYR